MWFIHSECYAGISVSGWRKFSVPTRCLLSSLRIQIRLNEVSLLSDLIILMVWKSRCVTVERLNSDTLDGRFFMGSRHGERVRVFRQGILVCLRSQNGHMITRRSHTPDPMDVRTSSRHCCWRESKRLLRLVQLAGIGAKAAPLLPIRRRKAAANKTDISNVFALSSAAKPTNC